MKKNDLFQATKIIEGGTIKKGEIVRVESVHKIMAGHMVTLANNKGMFTQGYFREVFKPVENTEVIPRTLIPYRELVYYKYIDKETNKERLGRYRIMDRTMYDSFKVQAVWKHRHEIPHTFNWTSGLFIHSYGYQAPYSAGSNEFLVMPKWYDMITIYDPFGDYIAVAMEFEKKQLSKVIRSLHLLKSIGHRKFHAFSGEVDLFDLLDLLKNLKKLLEK